MNYNYQARERAFRQRKGLPVGISLFQVIIFAILALIVPIVVGGYVSAQGDLTTSRAQSYMRSNCELLSNSAQTQYWYECNKEAN